MEVLKKSGKPVGLTMCIGPEGDLHGVSAGDCAVKLAKAGKKKKRKFVSLPNYLIKVSTSLGSIVILDQRKAWTRFVR